MPLPTTKVTVSAPLNARVRTVAEATRNDGGTGLTKEQIVERLLDQAMSQIEAEAIPQDTLPIVHELRRATGRRTGPALQERASTITNILTAAMPKNRGAVRLNERPHEHEQLTVIVEVIARMIDDPKFFSAIQGFVDFTRP